MCSSDLKFMRPEIEDDVVQKKLWEVSDDTIQALEKEGATRRAKEKQEREKAEAQSELRDGISSRKDTYEIKRASSRRNEKTG